MDIEVTEIGDEAAPQRVGRRALLGAGVGGAALSLLPLLSGRASASTTTTSTTPAQSTTTAESTTTTTAPPKRPTDADVTLLDFAEQLELVARVLYDKALAAQGWGADQLAVIATLRDAHSAYANSLAGLLGRKAVDTVPADLLAQLSSGWAGTTASFLDAAYHLESVAVATHGDIVGRLEGTDAAALIASIQIAEARHGTALADMAGKTDASVLLVDIEAASLAGQA